MTATANLHALCPARPYAGPDAGRAVSAMFLQRALSGWTVSPVGPYHDTLRRIHDAWRFHRRPTSSRA